MRKDEFRIVLNRGLDYAKTINESVRKIILSEENYLLLFDGFSVISMNDIGISTEELPDIIKFECHSGKEFNFDNKGLLVKMK